MLKPKVLLIDDSDDIHQIVIKTISDICTVTSSYSFEDGLKKFEKDEYAIVIIDLNLDDKNGMDLLKEFKSRPSESRFFIMTGKDSVNDELLGHTYGVHEYLKKPVNRDILKVIVQKNLKVVAHEAAEEIVSAPFHIYPNEFKALMTNEKGVKEELQLTVKEFKILVKLVSHPDKPFSREDLFNQIWESDSESTFRTIDMHVSSLRKKLGSNGHLIRTVHQVGYKFSH
jgi:DNA-binding response OmpR family regulator